MADVLQPEVTDPNAQTDGESEKPKMSKKTKIVIGVIVGLISVLIVVLIILFATGVIGGNNAIANANANANNSSPPETEYMVMYYNTDLGIDANGLLSNTPATFFIRGGKLVLASDDTKAIGYNDATPTDNSTAGIVNTANAQAFESLVGEFVEGPLKFAGTNQLLTRYGGDAVGPGNRLVTYTDFFPNGNQIWNVILA